MNTPKRNSLIAWIEASPSHRAVQWKDIPRKLDLGVPYGEEAISTALLSEGFRRRVSRVKPPLSAKNRQLRNVFT